MTSKADLLTAMYNLGQSMCINLGSADPARLAQSSLVTIQSLNKAFSDVDTQEVTLGCSNCTSMTAPDLVLLGSQLKALYASWTCDTNVVCTSACVTSYQMPYDLLSSAQNSSMMSGVVIMKMFNPETADELAVSDVTNGVVVKIYAKKQTNNTYVCLRWDGSSSWTTAYVATLTDRPVVSGNASYISCNMTKFGYVALFEGPPVIEPSSSITTTISPSTSVMSNSTVKVSATPAVNTTVKATATATVNTTATATVKNTAAVNSTATISATPSQSTAHVNATSVATTTTATTTLAPKNYPRQCKLTFPGNCSLAFDSSTQDKVAKDIKKQIAKAANINQTSMTNFTIKCGSIIASWQQTYDKTATAEQAVTLLQTALTSYSINITVNGNTFSADISSFTAQTIVPPYATVAPTSAPDDDLSGGAIAGIVIGVLIAVIIIALLVYIFFIRKKTRKDPKVEPNGNDLELRGKNNQAYENSP